MSLTHSPLFTDLYELKMLEAYQREGMTGEAVFTVFIRRLPPGRNFFLACGIETVLEYLENVRFDESDLSYLASLGYFSKELIESLRNWRFEGEVRAVPDGTPVFANEPIMEIRAPLAQAQLVETFITNQLHLQTLLASKAARVVLAAKGRPVVDFGARRMHGTDAALKAARAFYVAGVVATSNVLAGKLYGLPVAGTMAHSYVQAHDNEADAFRAFAKVYPDTTLLVDTYDTLDGVRHVIALARELGDAFKVAAVRLDSGDLVELAKQSRKLLDAAGLERVKIFASGGLDEHVVAKLVAEAPIDAFGVGTSMGVSADKPDLDIVYKLAEYAGRGRLKLAADKPVLPGSKQVFRFEENGQAVRDVIAREGEQLPGRPLLERVMRGGRRIESTRRTLQQARDHARTEIERLPAALHALEPAQSPYPVEISDALAQYQRELQVEIGERQRER